MKNTLKKNFILGVGGFIIIFGVLLTLASIFDLQVSDLLAGGSLEKGAYYTTNQFALFIEATGYSLIYLFGGLAAVIGFRTSQVLEKGNRFRFMQKISDKVFRGIKIFFMIAFAAFAVFEFYSVFHEFFDYPNRFLQEDLLGTGVTASVEGGYLVAIQLVCAICVVGLLILLSSRLDKERAYKLFFIAFIILITVLFYQIVIEAIKAPAGRMRYRTMNVIGDFSYYTPWYQFNGKRYLSASGEVVAGSLASEERYLGLGDTFKSFPSGHTYAAAISYVTICLPDLFEFFRKKVMKVLCWVFPIVLTGMVAIGRIMAGAHFFSDVLIGGTFAFLVIVIAREFLILRGAHFKALFSKN
jgi:membrane-associated phospholipid phosphatase